jgi:cobalt-zinc-cadmium efflux system membrane fusion protein
MESIVNRLKIFLQKIFNSANSARQKTLGGVIENQGKLYQSLHDQVERNTPIVTHWYDKLPRFFKAILFVLPWIIGGLLVLNYLNYFDKKQVIKSVQDPNIVIVSPDLRKMIVDGTVQVAPFVEEIRASGRIDFNELFLSKIGANVTGRVTEILAVPGQTVKQGDVLARIISTELTQSQLSFLKAKSMSQLADQAANRARILFKEDVIALAELQRREAESKSARAEYRAANDELRVFGMDQASIDRLAQSGVIESINQVKATISGEIVERKINKGQVVQPSDGLFTIADLSTLWAISEVPESNSYFIRRGQKATVIIPSLRNQEIEGIVKHVDSIVNPQTRTVVVRMEIVNKTGQIKPGMLATMLVESQATEKLVVPVSAVFREDNNDHVFIRLNDDKYRMISVKLEPEGKGYRPVIAGLTQGQEIALDGAYHLNTERKRQLNSQ